MTCSPAHREGQQQRNQEALSGSERTDRDSKGRFVRGNAGGPGNPFNRQAAALRQQVVDALTPVRMARIIEAVAQKAEKGDLAAAKLLWQYGMGKPAQPVQPDRMDQDELALYQEQLSPEDWLRMINSMPADMAVQILRPLRPVIGQSVGKHVQQMAKDSGIEVSKPAPSPTGNNGEQAPMGNGDNGNNERNANGGYGNEGGLASGASTASCSACPRQRGHGTPPAWGGRPLAEREDYTERPLTKGGNRAHAPMGNGSDGGEVPSANGHNGPQGGRVVGHAGSAEPGTGTGATPGPGRPTGPTESAGQPGGTVDNGV